MAGPRWTTTRRPTHGTRTCPGPSRTWGPARQKARAGRTSCGKRPSSATVGCARPAVTVEPAAHKGVAGSLYFVRRPWATARLYYNTHIGSAFRRHSLGPVVGV